ncbi:alkaline phosphatase family protein [Candidatus Parcubacteria bacterium]|nr:MAG: alkaline phosphatase family protein [Candidatus Parcubacteria bacterium]
MINRNSLNFFETFDKGRLFKPNYQNYSFANIPSTIYYLLTGKKDGNILPRDCFGKDYPKPKKTVLFFIDAFGFKAWEKYYKNFEITQKIVDQGVLTPISALFPSATAPSVSLINFGVPVLRHGIIEWYLYVKEYDNVIKSLPFRTLGYPDISGLDLGYDPKFLTATSLNYYLMLNNRGINSYRVMNEEIVDSVYNKLTEGSSKQISYSSLTGAFNSIKGVIEEKERSFVYFYWEGIDSAGHKFGPDSKEVEQEIDKFWSAFSKAFLNYKKDNDVLFLFVTDHGQIGIDPAKTFYLNLEIPELKDYLKLRNNGEIIYPTGACRDVMLHIKDERVDGVLELLEQKLKGIAKVLKTSEAVEMGLFGPPPYDEEAIERLGEILILPYGNNCVWWYEEGKLEVDKFGMHGGLSEQEMLSVFGVW